MDNPSMRVPSWPADAWAGKGSEVVITAQGPEAEAALDAVVGLIEGRFDEDC